MVEQEESAHGGGGPELVAPAPAIDSFFGPHRFLSSFWPAEVRLDGHTYPSVEHAYQAAKTPDPAVRREIRHAEGPGAAKRLGQQIDLSDDWPERRIPLMAELVEQKFAAPDLRRSLLATGTRPLVEGNRWGDVFWGVCRNAGTNHLGNLLMAQRERLQRLAPPGLALDLEGMILSDAVACFVRPRTSELLEWCRTRFGEIVIATSVPEARARDVVHRLIGLGDLPPWMAETRLVSTGRHPKRLSALFDAPERALLLDDQPTAVHPTEVGQWVAVSSWPGPEDPDDDALWTVRAAIEARLAERASVELAARTHSGGR